jgi:hypothetical protein
MSSIPKEEGEPLQETENEEEQESLENDKSEDEADNESPTSGQ